MPPETTVFSNELEVTLPRKERTFMVPIANWDQLKERIKRIEQSNPFIQTGIGIMLGITVTAAFGIISLPRDMPLWNGYPILFIYLTLLISSSLSAIAFAYLEYRLRDITQASKQDILGDMELLETRFRPDYEEDEEDNDNIQGAI